MLPCLLKKVVGRDCFFFLLNEMFSSEMSKRKLSLSFPLISPLASAVSHLALDVAISQSAINNSPSSGWDGSKTG